jgi:hypothetical protein
MLQYGELHLVLVLPVQVPAQRLLALELFITKLAVPGNRAPPPTSIKKKEL